MSDYRSTDALCPTFVVSSNVTQETLLRLNNAFSKDGLFTQEVKNFFNPVLQDLSQMLKPSRSPVKFMIEHTEDADPQKPQNRTNEVEEQVEKDRYEMVGCFVVLDDRSVEDDTLTLYFADSAVDDAAVEEGDPEGDDFDEDRLDEEHSVERLTCWRVRFSDAHEMAMTLDACEYVVIEDYISNTDFVNHYTDDGGLFDFHKATKDVSNGVYKW